MLIILTYRLRHFEILRSARDIDYFIAKPQKNIKVGNLSCKLFIRFQ